MRGLSLPRKPALTVAISAKPKEDMAPPGGAPDEGADESGEEAAVCPECGCVFDDATGETVGKDDPRYPKDDEGNSADAGDSLMGPGGHAAGAPSDKEA